MNGLKSASFWILIFLVFILIYMNVTKAPKKDELPISVFLKYSEEGRIIKCIDQGQSIEGKYYVDEARTKVGDFKTEYLSGQEEAVLQTARKHAEYVAKPPSTFFHQIFFSILLPILLFLGIWMLIMRQIQSGGNKAISFGKSRAKLVSEGQVKIKFDDVAGVDEAKEELKEIVEFLKDPKKFSRLGGKIPKGVLLYGPPGTGKTLLARAVAGEANVPFFNISGSDFVEMFVGVGASRVRDLFEQGKKSKPCLIFIDEIDAVGRHRFAGIGGGHDEREQTLNQLLVEMDGFSANEGVILIAATNRPDVLDPALLRPGRFDRQITVDFPDVVGREKIIKVHTKNIKVNPSADLKVIAKATPGFSGADLANMVNEAALLAARNNKSMVDQSDFEEAKDRVMMGPERRSLVLMEEEKIATAYHEMGHAFCALFLPDADPVHKVTIIPRGRSLGSTSILPSEDRHNKTKRQLKNCLVYLMGGLAAEEIIYNEFNTGASNDLQRATELSHRMICEFGMSEKLGPRSFGEPGNQVFLGKELARARNYSEKTADLIDDEVKNFIDEAHRIAQEILGDRKEDLHRIAKILVERETLDGQELKTLLKGEELSPLFKKTSEKETNLQSDLDKKDKNSSSSQPSVGRLGFERPKEIPS